MQGHILPLHPLFFRKNMFYKYVHDNPKGHQVAKGSQRRNPPDLRRHIRRTYDAGTDQQRHYP